MNGVVDRLAQLAEELAAAVDDAFADEQIAGLSDDDLMRLLDASGRVQRRLDAVQVEATVQVTERSDRFRDARLTAQHGCDRPADLLCMVLRVDRAGAHRLVRAASGTRRSQGITDGAFLPARYEGLRLALVSGDIGLHGLLAATDPLEQSRARITDAARVEADRQLGAFASGVPADDPGAGERMPVPTPDELAAFSRALAAYLDPDGAEPEDERASRNRGLRLGRLRDGVFPISGGLLPEVAAQLSRLNDVLLNPRGEPVSEPGGVRFTESDDDVRAVPADDRTRSQKLHDAFATILATAARSVEMPELGGAAPTLVVTVSASDYASGSGRAHVDGVEAPVSMRVAAQAGCAGGIQRVLFDERGRIVGIGTSGRIFNALQRRAIIARDGGCVIPGCTIPGSWCEFHHVTEHALGGPTHTDNGVALCWHHHRTLHLSQWQIRMRGGTPQVRGPAWWDPARRWHAAGKAGRRVPVRWAGG